MSPKLVSAKTVTHKRSFMDFSRDWDLTNLLEDASREGKRHVTRHVGGFERINKAYDSQRIVHLTVSNRQNYLDSQFHHSPNEQTSLSHLSFPHTLLCAHSHHTHTHRIIWCIHFQLNAAVLIIGLMHLRTYLLLYGSGLLIAVTSRNNTLYSKSKQLKIKTMIPHPGGNIGHGRVLSQHAAGHKFNCQC